jgi:hypothetical protein
MPKPLDIGAYPAHFLDLAGSFEPVGVTEKVLEFKSEAEMVATRLHLYGFLRALKRDVAAAEVYARFTRVRIFAAKRKPWRLTIRHADTTGKWKQVR